MTDERAERSTMVPAEKVVEQERKIFNLAETGGIEAVASHMRSDGQLRALMLVKYLGNYPTNGDAFVNVSERMVLLSDLDFIQLAINCGFWSDTYRQQLEDLWKSDPNVRKDHPDKTEFLTARDTLADGTVIFDPSKIEGRYCHVLSQTEHYKVLTSRNLPVISEQEQEKLSNLVVLIVGCSVGGGIAWELAKAGVQHFVLADGGTVDIHNMNRWPWAVDASDIGKPLVESLQREILKRNPNATVTIIPNIVNPEEVRSLIRAHQPDVAIEAIDGLPSKGPIQAAMLQEQVGLVLMPTDLGFSAIVQILQSIPFNDEGVTQEKIMAELQKMKDLPPEEQFGALIALARSIVGEENIPTHMKVALQKAIDQQTGYYPQPGVAATLAGALSLRAIIGHIRKEKQESLLSINLGD